MYKFKDTISDGERSTLTRPVEAVCINGEYIEDNVTGYRTLYVSGRESLEKEIETYDTMVADGSKIQRTRFPDRTITVGFQLIAENEYYFRTYFNKLNGLLNVKDAEIVFDDEPDKYFIGTPIMDTEVEEGRNAVTGEFQIYCADPFKYAAEEVTVETSTTSITDSDNDDGDETATITVLNTVNDGTHTAYPKFDVQFADDQDAEGDRGGNADCGYVLFAKDGTNYSIQFGSETEEDTSSKQIFSKSFTGGSMSGWSNASASSYTMQTSNYCISGSAYADTTSGKKGLKRKSGSESGPLYYGPVAVYTLPYAAEGAFKFTWKHVLALSNTTATGKKQAGSFWVLFFGENKKVVYGVGMNKQSTTKLLGTPRTYIYSDTSREYDKIDMSYTGKSGYKKKTTGSGKNKKTTYSERQSTNTVERYYDANAEAWYFKATPTFKPTKGYPLLVDDEPRAIKYVGLFFGKMVGGRTGWSHNRVLSAKFIDGDYDTINEFAAGDKLSVDTADMTVLKNGDNASQLGDISNDWGNMYLDPGANTIITQWSDFVVKGYEPTITMSYTKRWL